MPSKGVFLRGTKLQRQPASLLVTPKNDGANSPPFLPQSAPNQVLDLEVDSPWPGQLLAVTLGTALALATSVGIVNGFNHQDEVGTPAVIPVVVGTQSSLVAPQETRVVRYWPQFEDLPITPASLALEDGWQPFAPIADAVKSIVWATDEGGATTTPLAIDGDEWLQFAPLAGSIKSIVWATDEGGATALSLAFDGDEWLRFAPVAGEIKSIVWATDEGGATVSALPIDNDDWQPFAPVAGNVKSIVWATDEGGATVVSGAIGFDEAYWLQPFSITPARDLRLWEGTDEVEQTPGIGGGGLRLTPSTLPPRIIRWHQEDSIATAATPLQVEDEYWLKPFSISPPRDLRLWAENDDRIPAATPLPVEDNDWLQFAPKIGDVNGIVWASDESGVEAPQGTLPFDEAYWLKPFSITPPRDLRLWQGTDEIEQAAAPLRFDESYWIQPFSITPPRDLRLWATTDEIEQAPAALAIGGEDGYQPTIFKADYGGIVWASEEGGITVEQVAPPSEDYWLRPFSIRVEPVTWVGTHQDEQVRPAVPNEEYWHQLYSIPVLPIDRVERHQDGRETPPTPLFTDVEFWPAFQLRTAIVPALAPLFQADDEQGDFVAPPEPPAPSPAPGVDPLDPRYMGGRYPNVGFKPIKPPKPEKAKLEPPLPAQITNMPDAPILAPRRGPLMEILETLGREPLLKAPSPSKQAAPVIAKPAPAPKPKPVPQPTVAPAPPTSDTSGEILDAVREMMNVRESALREELRQVQEQLVNVQAELASKDDRAAQRKESKKRRKNQQVAAELSLKLLDDDI